MIQGRARGRPFRGVFREAIDSPDLRQRKPAAGRFAKLAGMTPTLFRADGFRYFFFSREETRMHVHVSHPDGTAKFWLEPEVALAWHTGLSGQQLRIVRRFIAAHQKEMAYVWRSYFSR